MNHHMWCSKPKIFTLALCGKCLLIPSLKRRAEISITVHKFTYEETCNLFFYIFTLFQAPFCQGGINHSAKLPGVMAMFLCSSKVTGCVSVSHPYRHPLRCPPFPLLFSGPAFPSIHWPCQVFSSFLDSGTSLRGKACPRIHKLFSCSYSTAGVGISSYREFLSLCFFGSHPENVYRSSLLPDPRLFQEAGTRGVAPGTHRQLYFQTFLHHFGLLFSPTIWNLFCSRDRMVVYLSPPPRLKHFCLNVQKHLLFSLIALF